MSTPTILVTGANRGIGFAIVEGLAQRSPDLRLVLASRSESNAINAVEELRKKGLRADFYPIELDVDDDQSITSAVQKVHDRFGRLDVLVNNAGIAGGLSQDGSDFRAVYNQILNTNVTSVALITTLFLPLLCRAENPRVINVSSGRASLTLVTTGHNPPTKMIPYSVSKAALNLMTIEMAHANSQIEFQLVNPGWCKTALNGYSGPKDPLEGAQSAIQLALADSGRYEFGFWKYDENGMEQIPW